jgi:hypothetical protein
MHSTGEISKNLSQLLNVINSNSQMHTLNLRRRKQRGLLRWTRVLLRSKNFNRRLLP